jgi:hypothetical protein
LYGTDALSTGMAVKMVWLARSLVGDQDTVEEAIDFAI